MVTVVMQRPVMFAAETLSGGLAVVNFATAKAGKQAKRSSKVRENLDGEDAIMKTTKVVMIIVTIAAALFILVPSLSWAGDDGATLFKAKCAACHGADGAGKPAAKIPSLIGDEARKASDGDLEKAITEKPKHAAVSKALAPDQVKMVVSYIRSVQK